jgi:hypothetical protein
MSTSVLSELDQRWVSETMRRVADDLALIVDRSFVIHGVTVERAEKRPAADGGVHISFKLALQRGDAILHGAVLLPFREAVLLGGWLQMLGDEEAKKRAAASNIDQSMKDALLEIGNFVAGAAEAACRTLDLTGARVVSEGCQGVKAGVRPAFRYTDGQPLTIGRAEAQLANGNPFTILALLPGL